MNRERIRALADHLENNVSDKEFSMVSYGFFTLDVRRNEFPCGTVACIGGWTLSLFRKEAAAILNLPVSLNTKDLAARILDLNHTEAVNLFVAGEYNWPDIEFNKLFDDITKDDAAKHLRSLLNE